jgi:hypothetical protein
MPAFTKKSIPTVLSPAEAKSVEMKDPAVKVDAIARQDPTEVETDVPQSKVELAIQATRDQMAKIIGQHRQDRPSTADQTIGRGPSASYGGYTKRK